MTGHLGRHDDGDRPEDEGGLETSWIRSRPFRIVVAVLVAVATTAVMLGWAFLGTGRDDQPDPPAVIEVSNTPGRV